ncbi:MAG TPA: nitroreductase family protein [Burkholderiaceae bacterium]
MTGQSTVEQILDLGRWAPSGDNTQPWRFEIVTDTHVVVHGFDTRDHCVYDLDGHPSQISLGALIETISIAASTHGLATNAARRLDVPDTLPTFDLHFSKDGQVQCDPLVAHITTRSVQRRPMRLRPLTATEKRLLEASVGDACRVQWLEGLGARAATARLMFDHAKFRLTMPEAYLVHRNIIEWDARFSEDRVPDQALGLDPVTAKVMHHVLGSWKRVRFFNRFLAGTIAPGLQMDLIPGLFCAAHFVLLATQRPQTVDDYVAAGRTLQRFWLTATSLGLVMQPELTPLIFSRYVRDGVSFSKEPGMDALARSLARKLEGLIGPTGTELAVFMGRIGNGPTARSRSTRKRLEQLIIEPAARSQD